MDRVLLVGAAMLAVGIALASVWVIINLFGTTFEMYEDSVARWLGK